MKVKKILPVLAAAALLFCTACSEAAPVGPSVPDPEATAAPEKNEFVHIGEPVEVHTMGGADMEYTVQKVQVFEHYTDAGITADECIFGLNDAPFILIDIKFKKIDGPEWTEDGFDDDVNAFDLTSRTLINDPIALSVEMCYFSGQYSGHSKEDEKDYTSFWLDPGEEQVFQLGWCLHDGTETGPKEKSAHLLTEPEGLLLCMEVNGHTYVDLET